MSRHRTTLRRGVLTSLIAAAATFVALTAWRGFVQDSPSYIGPLMGFTLACALLGAFTRWARFPVLLVLALQVVLLGGWLLASFGAHGLELTEENIDSLAAAFRHAVDSAQTYAAPVPRKAPSPSPILVAGGGICLILVDALAVGLGRVPLAGLPILLVYSLPISIMDDTIGTVPFIMVAAGFLALLFLREDERFGQWGRTVEAARRGVGSGQGERSGNSAGSATTIGLTVTSLALFVPIVIPELDYTVFDGQGPGRGTRVQVENPMTDLRTDLQQGPDVPLLQVRTDDPHPDYLKLAVLTNFTGAEWTTGNRLQIPSSQAANGKPMLPIPGLDPRRVETMSYSYDFTARDNFDATWLVVPSLATSALARGIWLYDADTRDFVAMAPAQSTSGQQWSATGDDPRYDPLELNKPNFPPIGVTQRYTNIPVLPAEVSRYTAEATSGAPTDYQKAIALQNWFRDDDRFEYTTDLDTVSGSTSLAEFLSPTGRRGYCEQFASAFAVMARYADLPSRVVVGLINPQEISAGTFQFTTHDMHAWPEIYFSGAGWVRFEPTPGNSARAPGYTQVDLPTAEPSVGVSGPEESESSDRPTAPTSEASDPTGSTGTESNPLSLTFALVALLSLVVLAGLAWVPRLLRGARRKRRWSIGTAEAAWRELRDIVHDLRLTWLEGRSPREVAARVATRLAADDDSERPALGPDRNPEAAAALDRLVTAVELERYSGRALVVDPAELQRDVEACEAALLAGVTSGARRRARWLPASLRRTRGEDVVAPMRSSRDSVVDRVT